MYAYYSNNYYNMLKISIFTDLKQRIFISSVEIFDNMHISRKQKNIIHNF